VESKVLGTAATKEKRSLRVSGILMLVAVVINILGMALVITQIVDPKSLLHVAWAILPFPLQY